MARKISPTISQEELYRSSADVRAELDDARMLDLDAGEESPFLRGQKRVSARRGSLPKKTANRVKWVLLVLVVAAVVAIAAPNLYSYGEHCWRFRIASSDDIEITGIHSVPRAQVMEVMGGDIGRNVFFVPLGQRKLQLEQIPWVESASVMRFIPNRLKVDLHERTPVAFARVGSRIALVDSSGVIMDLPAKRKYSFPVIVGMNPSEPLSTRAARMKIYNQLVRELDSSGAHYSEDLSEVDLSDPDDVKVLASDSHGAVVVDLGSSNFLDRYKVYITHVAQWRQQFEKLDSVDLRYDRQIIVNPDLGAGAKQAPLTAGAARAAMAAGVKPAALLRREALTAKGKVGGAVQTKPVVKPLARKRRIKREKPKHTGSKPTARSAPGKPTTTVATATNVSKTSTSQTTQRSDKPLPDRAQTTKKPSPAIAKEQGNP